MDNEETVNNDSPPLRMVTPQQANQYHSSLATFERQF